MLVCNEHPFPRWIDPESPLPVTTCRHALNLGEFTRFRIDTIDDEYADDYSTYQGGSVPLRVPVS